MERNMAHAQTAETNDNETGRGARPVKTFKQGGVESVSGRIRPRRATCITIRNSYKDDKSGGRKETASFSPTDLTGWASFQRRPFRLMEN
jgi:hypothetical protein